MAEREKLGGKSKSSTRHYCSQREAIARINFILVGNGTPEGSLLFKVAGMADHISNMSKDIAEIKEDTVTKKDLTSVLNSVNDLSKMYESTLEAAVAAKHAIEIYKAEEGGKEKGRDLIITDGEKFESMKHNKRVRTLQTIGLFIAGIGLLVTASFTVANFVRGAESVSSSTNKSVVENDKKDTTSRSTEIPKTH